MNAKIRLPPVSKVEQDILQIEAARHFLDKQIQEIQNSNASWFRKFVDISKAEFARQKLGSYIVQGVQTGDTELLSEVAKDVRDYTMTMKDALKPVADTIKPLRQVIKKTASLVDNIATTSFADLANQPISNEKLEQILEVATDTRNISRNDQVPLLEKIHSVLQSNQERQDREDSRAHEERRESRRDMMIFMRKFIDGFADKFQFGFKGGGNTIDFVGTFRDKAFSILRILMAPESFAIGWTGAQLMKLHGMVYGAVTTLFNRVIGTVVKRFPLIAMAAGVYQSVTDYLETAIKKEAFNTSEVSAGLAGALAGTTNDFRGKMENVLKGAGIGAGIGMIGGPIGVIAGAIIGGGLGLLFNHLGPEKIAQWLDDAGTAVRRGAEFFLGFSLIDEADLRSRIDQTQAHLDEKQKEFNEKNAELLRLNEVLRDAMARGDTQLIEATKQKIDDVKDSIEKIQANIERDKTLLAEYTDELVNGPKTLWGWFGDQYRNFSEFIDGFFIDLEKKVNEYKDAFIEYINNWWENSYIKSFMDGIADKFKSIMESIEAKFKWIDEKINYFWSWLNWGNEEKKVTAAPQPPKQVPLAVQRIEDAFAADGFRNNALYPSAQSRTVGLRTTLQQKQFEEALRRRAEQLQLMNINNSTNTVVNSPVNNTITSRPNPVDTSTNLYY